MNLPCPPYLENPTHPFLNLLTPEAAHLFQWIEAYAAHKKLAPPFPISICRSAETQKELQEAWDRGEREGLSARPADPETSMHVPNENGQCSAFDLGNDYKWLSEIGPAAIKNVPGARWGGLWLPPDYVHFDIQRTRVIEIRLV
jgi:hypothetical protein